MTREIDPDAIAAGTLTFAEAEYLRVRGKLPAGYEMPDPEVGDVAGEPVAPSTMENVNIQRYPVETVGTPLEEQTVPQFGNNGGIEEEDSEFAGVGGNYSKEEGWNNDKRRAELSKRGLVVTGNAEAMIDRLRRHDGDNLTDDDFPEADDESDD